MATTNVIFRGSVECNKPIQDEALAAASTLPGTLLFKNAGAFTAFNTDGAGAGVNLYVADLNFLQQGSTTDAWAAGDTLVAFEPQKGERYNMLVATGQTITAVDTPLAADGAGLLRIGVVGTDDIICYADQVITTSATTLVAVKF